MEIRDEIGEQLFFYSLHPVSFVHFYLPLLIL